MTTTLTHTRRKAGPRARHWVGKRFGSWLVTELWGYRQFASTIIAYANALACFGVCWLVARVFEVNFLHVVVGFTVFQVARIDRGLSVLAKKEDSR
jgi:hypothetical protein